MKPFNWFKYPSAITPKHHNTITDSLLYFTVGTTHDTIALSLSILRTKILLFRLNNLNFDSSVYSTLFHSLTLQFLCLLHHISPFFLFSHRRNGFLTATWPWKPLEISLRFTVVRDTGFSLEEFKTAINSGVLNLLFLLQFNMSHLSSPWEVSLLLPKHLQALFSSVSFFFLREYCAPYLDISNFLSINLCEYVSLERISICATVSIDIPFFRVIWGLKQNIFSSLND